MVSVEAMVVRAVAVVLAGVMVVRAVAVVLAGVMADSAVAVVVSAERWWIAQLQQWFRWEQ